MTTADKIARRKGTIRDLKAHLVISLLSLIFITGSLLTHRVLPVEKSIKQDTAKHQLVEQKVGSLKTK